MTITAENVKSFIMGRYPESMGSLGYTPETVPDDLDLLQSGVIDSLGIMELITSLEDHYGRSLDLEHLPAEQLTVVGPFSRYVASAVSGTMTTPMEGNRMVAKPGR